MTLQGLCRLTVVASYIPHIADEIVVSRKNETATLGYVYTGDAAQNMVIAESSDICTGSDIEYLT